MQCDILKDFETRIGVAVAPTGRRGLYNETNKSKQGSLIRDCAVL